MASHDDYISAEQFTVEELRAAVFEGRGSLGPAVALNLLALKDYREKEADMQRLLEAEDGPPRLRLTAAQTLSALASDSARSALFRALETHNPVVLRGVVAALGRVSGREAIERVRQIDRSKLDRATLMHMTRAAYLHNMEGFDLPARRDLTLLDPAKFEMQPITAEPASAELRSRALADLQAEGLPIELEPESTLRITCLGHDLLLVLNRALSNASLEEATRRRMFVGVIADFEDVETDNWSADYSILTQPGENGAVDIRVVTSGGLTAYAGEGTLRDGQIVFSLRAVDHPGARAAVIEGAFANGRVRLTNALSTHQQQPRKTPQRSQ